MSCVYTGDRVPSAGGPGVVTYRAGLGLDRRPFPLPPCHSIRNHSPDGFQWGYGGSGPAQLALALCVHALGGDIKRALNVYQQFKALVVAALPDAWELDQDTIVATIEQIERGGE